MLIEQIKADQVKARKERNVLMANLLTTLIGEAEMIGKNNGNRSPTDSEVVAMIKKFVKNLNETIQHLMNAPVQINTDSQKAEVAVLEAYLPKQLTTDQLTECITLIVHEISANPKDMGKVLALLKLRHDGTYDGKTASVIAKNLIAGV